MKFPKLNKHALIIISYLLISCLFLYPLLLGKTLILMDNILHIAPMYSFWKTEIFAGRLPLWNPYVFAGLPFIGDSSHPLFNPGNFAYLVIPNIYVATHVQLILAVGFTALGMYYLSRSLGISRFCAWLGGVAVSFGGTVFSDINDLNSVYGVMFMPWIIGSYINMLNKKPKGMFCVVLFSVLLLISGHTQYLYYTFLCLVVLCVEHVLTNKTFRNKRAMFELAYTHAGTVLLVLSMGAFSLLPQFELLSYVQRSSELQHHTIHSEKLIAIVRVFMPTLFGKLNEGTSWGPGTQLEFGMAGTHGFLPLIMVFAAIVAVILLRNTRYVRSFILLGTLALILSFGTNIFLYNVFRMVVPGWSMFRSPTRILSIYTIATSVLGAFGLDYVLSNYRLITWKYRKILYAILLISLVSLLLWLLKPGILYVLITWVYQSVKHTALVNSVTYPQAKLEAISALALRAVTFFGLGISAILLLTYYALKQRLKYLILISGFVVLECFVNVRGNLVFAPLSLLSISPKTVDYLKRHLNDSRFISTSETQAYTGIWVYYNHLFVRPPFSSERVTSRELSDWQYFRNEIDMIPSNLNMTVPLRSSAGYVALLPDTYRRYAGSKAMNSIHYSNYDNPVLNNLATKYIITGIPSDALAGNQSGKYKNVFNDGKTTIYENKNSKPRAQFIDTQYKGISAVQVNDINPRTVQMQVQATQSGTLVLRDYYYPGWVATVDGIQQKILEYDTLFRSLQLQSGYHTVRFEYKPLSFKIGSIFC